MTVDRERALSEYIDAWNAGRRPDVDDCLARVPASERAELADQLAAFLSLAPTPSYDDAALRAIRSEPDVAEALAATGRRGGLLPALLPMLRERLSMTPGRLAAELVRALGLPSDREPKTAAYLERLERGELEPARISRRVLGALAHILGVARDELEGAGDLGGPRPAPAPVFRAEDEAAEAVADHLDVLADALQAPGEQERDEVDELFLGGR